jgi:hypothetical protein
VRSAKSDMPKLPRRRRESISLWDLYSFAYFLVFRSLRWQHKKQLLQMLVEPCNYWRNVEVPAVLNYLQPQVGKKILDIGSPKLPSLFLRSRVGAEVYATDLLPYFVEEYSYFSGSLNRGHRQSESPSLNTSGQSPCRPQRELSWLRRLRRRQQSQAKARLLLAAHCDCDACFLFRSRTACESCSWASRFAPSILLALQR